MTGPSTTATRRTSPAAWLTSLLALMTLTVLAAGCGAESVDVDSAADSAESSTPAADEETTTTTEPTATTVETTTTTIAVEPSDPEPRDCDAECPLTEEELATIQATLDAYNTADWEAFTATQRTDSPEWDTPVGRATTNYVRWDFIWSEAMSEVWTLGDCYRTGDDRTCRILIEDDLHRALDLDPSDCRFWFDIAPDESGTPTAKITQYIIEPCHRGYDSAMHAYGAWFDRTHPDEDPIQGRHYRAWNQPDETAGKRAAAYLDEYIASGEAGHGDH